MTRQSGVVTNSRGATIRICVYCTVFAGARALIRGASLFLLPHTHYLVAPKMISAEAMRLTLGKNAFFPLQQYRGPRHGMVCETSEKWQLLFMPASFDV